MCHGQALDGGQWNKQKEKCQSKNESEPEDYQYRVFIKLGQWRDGSLITAWLERMHSNQAVVESPAGRSHNHPTTWPENQTRRQQKREEETTGQDLNFFFLLYPLWIQLYQAWDKIGTIIRYKYTVGGGSACLASLPVALPLGPLCRLQGHQLGATLHQ